MKGKYSFIKPLNLKPLKDTEEQQPQAENQIYYSLWLKG